MPEAGGSSYLTRQQYWSGLSFLPLGDLPHSRTEPEFPVSSALAGRFFTTEPPGKLKEISPGCSLEELMLKLKLQYFGHLMGRRSGAYILVRDVSDDECDEKSRGDRD